MKHRDGKPVCHVCDTTEQVIVMSSKTAICKKCSDKKLKEYTKLIISP